MTAATAGGTALARRVGRRSIALTVKCIGPRRRFLLRPALFIAFTLRGLLLGPALVFALAVRGRLLRAALFFPLVLSRFLLGSLTVGRLLGADACRRFALGSQPLRRLPRLALFGLLALRRLLCPKPVFALTLRRLLLLFARLRLRLPQTLGLLLLAQVLRRLGLLSQPFRLLLRPLAGGLFLLRSQALRFPLGCGLLLCPLASRRFLLPQPIRRLPLRRLGRALFLAQTVRDR